MRVRTHIVRKIQALVAILQMHALGVIQAKFDIGILILGTSNLGTQIGTVEGEVKKDSINLP